MEALRDGAGSEVRTPDAELRKLEVRLAQLEHEYATAELGVTHATLVLLKRIEVVKAKQHLMPSRAPDGCRRVRVRAHPSCLR